MVAADTPYMEGPALPCGRHCLTHWTLFSLAHHSLPHLWVQTSSESASLSFHLLSLLPSASLLSRFPLASIVQVFFLRLPPSESSSFGFHRLSPLPFLLSTLITLATSFYKFIHSASKAVSIVLYTKCCGQRRLTLPCFWQSPVL